MNQGSDTDPVHSPVAYICQHATINEFERIWTGFSLDFAVQLVRNVQRLLRCH